MYSHEIRGCYLLYVMANLCYNFPEMTETRLRGSVSRTSVFCSLSLYVDPVQSPLLPKRILYTETQTHSAAEPSYIAVVSQWCEGAAREETFIQQRHEYSRSRNASVATCAVYLL